jgi:hypothetical protein
MDCNTARLFLHFLRPDGADLAGPEAEELEDHLSQCTDCNAISRNERRFDQHLGRAMRAVAVPAALRGDILDRLAEQRSLGRRRWLRYASRGALAAVLLLAVSLGWYFWYGQQPRVIDLERIAYPLTALGPGTDTVNSTLKRLGDRGLAPSFVNYAYLMGAPAIAELPGYEGVKVPQLVFHEKAEKLGDGKRWAIIFVLDPRRFRIDDETPISDSKFKIDVYEHNHCTYLVLYSGNSWEWLKVPDPAE